MNHASTAGAPPDPELIQAGDATWQRAKRRGLVQGMRPFWLRLASAWCQCRVTWVRNAFTAQAGELLSGTVQCGRFGRIVGLMEGVSATLNYVDPSSQRNRLYVAPGGHMRTAWYAPRTVRICDGRPFRDDFGLDRSGFALLDHDSAVTDFGDPGQLDGGYTDEGTGLVREVTGADEVVPLGWVIRRAGEDKRGAQPPAPDVHVDVHPGRAHDRMTAAASNGRPFRRAIMTSLWRAFSPPPQDWPLAILDYRSVTDTEGVPNLLLFVDTLPDPDDVPGIPDPDDAPGIAAPDDFPAGAVFSWRPEHRWWYFPGMHAGETLLFKLHDTDHSVAWRAPHTAFRDAGASGAHPRESVELRTVAFFY